VFVGKGDFNFRAGKGAVEVRMAVGGWDGMGWDGMGICGGSGWGWEMGMRGRG
jgi:hypothetical protein